MTPHLIAIENLQTEDIDMPVAPQILPGLQQLVSNCNTNPDDIRDKIRMDPALSAMILRTANSAYFSPGYHIDSIDDAIMQLGFSEVYQIVTMLAFSKLLASELTAYGLSAKAFWRRSVACALAMDRLARKYGEEPGVAYTIGLLHGLGMVFMQREIEKMEGVALQAEMPEDVAVAREEAELFGVTHAQVGAAVMQQWGFSDEIAVPVRCQFEPSEAGRHERMACLMSFAKRMIGTIIDDGATSSLPGPDPLLIALLHLSKEEYQRVIEQLRERFAKAEGLVSEESGGSGAPPEAKTVKKKAMASNLGYGVRQIRG